MSGLAFLQPNISRLTSMYNNNLNATKKKPTTVIEYGYNY